MVAFIDEIRQVKVKHAWSIKIMKEIIKNACIYARADPSQIWDREEPSQDDQENAIKVMKKGGKFINIFIYVLMHTCSEFLYY